MAGATNVSLALLGYYLAVLIQIKSEEQIPDLIPAALILCILLTSVLIGFYLKIRCEIIDWYKVFKEGVEGIATFLNRVRNVFEQKGISVGDKLDFKISHERIEGMRKRYPMKLICLQFLLLASGVVGITTYLIKYIFLG